MRERQPNDVCAAIDELSGCCAGFSWATKLPREVRLEDGWNQCPRGDWLLWLLMGLNSRCVLDNKWVVLANCAVARLGLPPTHKVDPAYLDIYAKCLCTLELAEECVYEHAEALSYRRARGSGPYRTGPLQMFGNVDAVRFSAERLWVEHVGMSDPYRSPYMDLVCSVIGAANHVPGVRVNDGGNKAFVYGLAHNAARRNATAWTKILPWFGGDYVEHKFQKDSANAVRAAVPWSVIEKAYGAHLAGMEKQG